MRFIKADLVPRGATGFQERYASVAPRWRGLWKGEEVTGPTIGPPSHRARDAKVLLEKKKKKNRGNHLFMHPHTRDTVLEYE